MPSRINAPGNYTIACSFQTTENQRKRKISAQTQKRNHLSYKGTKIRITSTTSSKTKEARKDWSEMFEV